METQSGNGEATSGSVSCAPCRPQVVTSEDLQAERRIERFDVPLSRLRRMFDKPAATQTVSSAFMSDTFNVFLPGQSINIFTQKAWEQNETGINRMTVIIVIFRTMTFYFPFSLKCSFCLKYSCFIRILLKLIRALTTELLNTSVLYKAKYFSSVFPSQLALLRGKSNPAGGQTLITHIKNNYNGEIKKRLIRLKFCSVCGWNFKPHQFKSSEDGEVSASAAARRILGNGVCGSCSRASWRRGWHSTPCVLKPIFRASLRWSRVLKINLKLMREASGSEQNLNIWSQDVIKTHFDLLLCF